MKSILLIYVQSLTVIQLTLWPFLFGICQEKDTFPDKKKDLPDVEYLFEKGIDLYNDERIPEAIEHFESVCRADPGHYRSRYFLGLSFEKTGELVKAIYHLENGLLIRPDFREALFSLGMIYYKNQDFENSILTFKKLLETEPGETTTIYYRGIHYGDQDQSTGFDQMITMENQYTDIYYFMGLAYQKLNLWEESLKSFDRAIGEDNRNDNLFVNRALVYISMNKPEQALNDLNSALSINPDNNLARFNLFALSEPEPETGIKILNEMIGPETSSPEFFASRAYYKLLNSDLKGSLSDYDSAILLNSENKDYYIHRGYVFEKLENLEAALKNYRIAAILDPTYDIPFEKQGNIYFKLKLFDTCIDFYSRAIQINPGNSNAIYNRGLAYYYLHDYLKSCLDMQAAYLQGMEEAKNFIETCCEK